MKKIFDIQLFADEAPASPSAATAPSGTDTKPTGNNTEKEPGKDTKADAKYNDADLDRIIGQKFAEWKKQEQKAVDEAKKLAEMNAQQKAEYERDQVMKELEAYKRKDALAEMAKTARKMLADESINVSDELLSMMVTTDAANTKAAVDSFAKMFKDSVESAVKERLRGDIPRRGTGGTSPVSEIEKRIKKYE